jgi:hypothetical protein
MNWRVVVALASAVVCHPLSAGLVAPRDLPKMVKAANVIVAGEVTKYRSGPVSDWSHPVTLTVTVSRTIKGPAYPAGVALSVNYVDRPQTNINVNPGDFRLFFLRCASATTCSPAMEFHLEAPALPAGLAVASSNGDATDRVRSELLAMVAADDRVLAGLTRVVTEPPRDKASIVRLEALGLLAKLPLAPIVDTLKGLAQAPAPGPRLAAIAALGWEKDYSMLARADVEVLYPTPATEQLARVVAGVLERHGEAPSAEVLAAATRWLPSRDVEVRRNAASALREQGTAAAGTALARHGLDDPDLTVRYFSVGGLTVAFGEGRYPSSDVYAKNEQKYLAPWLAWRDANRVGIEQGSCCVRPEPRPEPPSVAAPPTR